ncbi:PBSX family phage terminase large subunit [uncultured Thiodictyon sp.]|uniref:PBSX family phage terminase large subunit n=1 Tax=uncultured Thiodictyon sp. TaxID=1846217 RepID=UPI0025DB8E3C|nr:PBSX family phage terminase large subunit [uncultured Thiodictyon sp.]
MLQPQPRKNTAAPVTRLQAAAILELRRRERIREREAQGGGRAAGLPPWAEAFQQPARYKVAWGGRGSGKSHTFARMLLLQAAQRPLRVLCARELQISIRDSVHRLLSDLVGVLGLADQFDVGQSYLRGHNGSEFIFKGLRHNATEIKSTEGIDRCFIEEAQAVSEDSWQLLIPTIRAPGSEIWAVFNPDQDSDPTYRRFVTNPPEHATVRRVNYTENPWFPPELELERAYMARTDPDAYAHVWLGECRTHTDAQVLAGKWIIDVFEPGADWDGPYFGADWGFAKDPTALVKCWIAARRLYIEHEAWGVEVSLNDTPALFDRVPGARSAIVRADSARPETIQHVRELGYPGLRAAQKWPGSVEDGVEFLRSFERIVIHERCKHVAEEARLWSYKTDRRTGDVLPVLKDGWEHTFDSVRYSLTPLIRQRKSALWLPEDTMNPEQERLIAALPGVDKALLLSISDAPDGACGGCTSFKGGWCAEREVHVGARDPGCILFARGAA